MLLTEVCSTRSPGGTSLATYAPAFHTGNHLPVLQKSDWCMKMTLVPQALGMHGRMLEPHHTKKIFTTSQAAPARWDNALARALESRAVHRTQVNGGRRQAAVAQRRAKESAHRQRRRELGRVRGLERAHAPVAQRQLAHRRLGAVLLACTRA